MGYVLAGIGAHTLALGLIALAIDLGKEVFAQDSVVQRIYPWAMLLLFVFSAGSFIIWIVWPLWLLPLVAIYAVGLHAIASQLDSAEPFEAFPVRFFLWVLLLPLIASSVGVIVALLMPEAWPGTFQSSESPWPLALSLALAGAGVYVLALTLTAAWTGFKGLPYVTVKSVDPEDDERLVYSIDLSRKAPKDAQVEVFTEDRQALAGSQYKRRIETLEFNEGDRWPKPEDPGKFKVILIDKGVKGTYHRAIADVPLGFRDLQNRRIEPTLIVESLPPSGNSAQLYSIRLSCAAPEDASVEAFIETDTFCPAAKEILEFSKGERFPRLKTSGRLLRTGKDDGEFEVLDESVKDAPGPIFMNFYRERNVRIQPTVIMERLSPPTNDGRRVYTIWLSREAPENASVEVIVEGQGQAPAGAQAVNDTMR